MHFYQALGYLVFGSRLRRLSESFLGDVNRIYQEQGIQFEASWFPVFYLLSERQEVSIRDISDELAVSHSAVSQLVSNLQQKGLIVITASGVDGRKKVIVLSEAGKELLEQVTPVWNALTAAMQSMMEEKKNSKHILKAIGEIENLLDAQPLFERVQKQLK